MRTSYIPMDEPSQEQYAALAAAHLGHEHGHDAAIEMRRNHDRLRGGALALYHVRPTMTPAPSVPAAQTSGGGMDRQRAKALEILEGMRA